MQVIFDHSQTITPTIKTFWFHAAQKPDYSAGQFVELYLPHDEPDSRGQKRWFTLSSSPTENLLAITTRLPENTGSTFKQRLFSLKQGDKATMSQPMGDFILPLDSSIPLVFVAAGVGITPVRSMITWLNDKKDRRDVHVVYAVRNTYDIAFRELLSKYSDKTNIIAPITNPSEGLGIAGPLDASLLLNLVPQTTGKLLYISGPESFVEKLQSGLISVGIPSDQLVLDFYHGYTSI